MDFKTKLQELRNKRGNMNVLASVAIGVVIFIVVIVLGFKIAEVIQGTTTTNSLAYNASADLQGSNGLGLVVDMAPVVIIVLIMAAVLGVLYYFGAFGNKGQ